MRKRLEHHASRRHVFLYDEDWEFLESTFSRANGSALTPAQAIREIVHRQVRKYRAASDENNTSTSTSAKEETTP